MCIHFFSLTASYIFLHILSFQKQCLRALYVFGHLIFQAKMWWSTFIRTPRTWRTANNKAVRGWLWIWISHLKPRTGKQPDSGSICAPLCFPLSEELSRLCLSTQAVFLNFPDYKYPQKILIKYSSTSDLLKKESVVLFPGKSEEQCERNAGAKDELGIT